MTNSIAEVVNNCQNYVRNSGQGRHQKHSQLFSAGGLFAFVALDIMKLSPNTKIKDFYFILMSKRYLKPTRAMETSLLTATSVAYIFFAGGIILHKISAFILPENKTKITRKLLVVLRTLLKIR